MKILLIVSLFVFVSFAIPTQTDPITNTKWDGANGLVVQFSRKDTIKMILDDKVVATALYKVQDTVLIWRDYLKSAATCDTSIRGRYRYNIKDDVMTFRVISDRCEERANVIQTFVLIKK